MVKRAKECKYLRYTGEGYQEPSCWRQGHLKLQITECPRVWREESLDTPFVCSAGTFNYQELPWR